MGATESTNADKFTAIITATLRCTSRPACWTVGSEPATIAFDNTAFRKNPTTTNLTCTAVAQAVKHLLILLAALLLVPPVMLRAAANEPLIARRAMQVADKDKDGRLSLPEYLPLDVQAKHHGDEHFAAGDANKDGFLDAAELAAALHKQTWFAILSQGTEACFTRLDADNDGRLDVAEYRKISRMGGHAEQHFLGADADKDGLLNLTEFTDHAVAKLKALEDGAPKMKRAKK